MPDPHENLLRSPSEFAALEALPEEVRLFLMTSYGGYVPSNVARAYTTFTTMGYGREWAAAQTVKFLQSCDEELLRKLNSEHVRRYQQDLPHVLAKATLMRD